VYQSYEDDFELFDYQIPVELQQLMKNGDWWVGMGLIHVQY
jgi:hypothetical protein